MEVALPHSYLCIVLAILTLVGAGRAGAADCEGTIRQVHRVGNFSFVTSSHVETGGTLSSYRSCVLNLDPGTDLYVDWPIAGPYGSYVPALETVTSPRMRRDGDARPIQGCIRYGALGATTPADFMGTMQDEDEAREGGACATTQARAQVSSPVSLPEMEWSDDFRIFLPSDPKRVAATMLVVQGRLGIRREGDGYTSFLDYSAGRYEGRPDGDPEAVQVEVDFPGPSEVLYSDFDRNNPRTRVLGSDGSISFTSASATADWTVATALYRFVDASGQALASLPMPVLVAAGRN